jgi:hypothetical protein
LVVLDKSKESSSDGLFFVVDALAKGLQRVYVHTALLLYLTPAEFARKTSSKAV